MKRTSTPRVVVIATLALLVALESAHCVCMRFQTPVESAAAAPLTKHECCCPTVVPEPGHQSDPAKALEGCSCQLLPAVTLPTAMALGTEASATTSITALPIATVIASVSTSVEIAPARDVGNPSLLDDPSAHGLRAPPTLI